MRRSRIQGYSIFCRLEQEELWLPFVCLVQRLVLLGGDIHVSIRTSAGKYIGVAAFRDLGVSTVQVGDSFESEDVAKMDCVVCYGTDGPIPAITRPSVYIPASGNTLGPRRVSTGQRRYIVLASAASIDGVELAIASLLCLPYLAGRHFLITAGPTVENIDPVRFISNPSSGKMGLALALAAVVHGASVTLVHGPMSVAVPDFPGLVPVPVRSTASMHDCVMSRIAECDVAIMCAAVADFTPASVADRKIKKETDGLTSVPLVRTPDILADVGRLPDRPVLVGFAAETHDVAANAAAKLERKNCDFICANDVSQPGSGFAADTNRITIYRRGQPPVELPMLSKEEVADRILVEVAGVL